MRKSATAVSRQPARSGDQETNSKRGSIIIGLEGVLQSVSEGENQ
jgi:hypothetical protein